MSQIALWQFSEKGVCEFGTASLFCSTKVFGPFRMQHYPPEGTLLGQPLQYTLKGNAQKDFQIYVPIPNKVAQILLYSSNPIPSWNGKNRDFDCTILDFELETDLSSEQLQAPCILDGETLTAICFSLVLLKIGSLIVTEGREHGLIIAQSIVTCRCSLLGILVHHFNHLLCITARPLTHNCTLVHLDNILSSQRCLTI